MLFKVRLLQLSISRFDCRHEITDAIQLIVLLKWHHDTYPIIDIRGDYVGLRRFKGTQPCLLWAVGCQLWAVSCGLSAVGCQLWAVCCGLSAVERPQLSATERLGNGIFTQLLNRYVV